MDTLVKENENLSKLNIFFKGSSKDIIKIVGRVVSEKMYFYKHIGEVIEKDYDFKIQEIILAPSQQSQKKDEKLRERIRSQIKKRAQKAEDAHFKDDKNVEPIFVYTCEETHNFYTD